MTAYKARHFFLIKVYNNFICVFTKFPFLFLSLHTLYFNFYLYNILIFICIFTYFMFTSIFVHVYTYAYNHNGR